MGRAGTWGGTNAGARRQAGEPIHGGVTRTGRSIWFRWYAHQSGRAVFHTKDSRIDTVLAVYTGGSLADLTRVATNDDSGGKRTSRVVFNAVAGRTYRIAISGKAGAEAFVDRGVYLRWNTGPPPANDNFTNARVVWGESGILRGWTTGASRERGEPRHDGKAGGASVWFKWIAPGTGQASFGLTETEWQPLSGDGVLAVYTGRDVAHLTKVPGSDFLEWPSVDVAFRAIAGTTYFIAVDGVLEKTGSYLFNWVLRPPLNDAFSRTKALRGSAGRVVAYTDGATAEAGEPKHGGYDPKTSVWFDWEAPGSGTATIDTFGLGWQTVLGVYRGSTLSSLTPVATNVWMNGWSKATFAAQAGVHYRIAVDSPYHSGIPVSLNWRMGGDREWTTPTVALSAPSAGAAVGGWATSAAIANDNVTIDRVKLTVGGVWVTADDVAAPYQGIWDSTQFDDAERSVEATAFDLGSNQATASRTIVTENHLPNVWVSAQPEGAVRGRSAGLAWRATEEISKAECSLDNAPYTACDDVVWYHRLADGRHVFRVRVWDRFGKADPSLAWAVWTVDTAPVLP